MVFIPKFDSWRVFWELAGRPSLIFIIIGFISGFLLRIYKKGSIRAVHGLNYVGLTFGFIHGFLIGTDFKNPFIILIFLFMYLVSLCILVRKRMEKE